MGRGQREWEQAFELLQLHELNRHFLTNFSL